MSRPTYEEMRTRTERISDEEIKESVLAGIEVLKAEFGDEWVERIDCQTLDLRDGAYCVLGQVCGSYPGGVTYLGDDSYDWAERHGFNVKGVGGHEEIDGAWEELDEAWHVVLCSGEMPNVDWPQVRSDMSEKME